LPPDASQQVVTMPSAALPDPLALYSPPLFKGFARYLGWYVKRHFHAVLIALDGLPQIPADKPLIIYSNHPSWWDPLMFVLIGESLFPGRRGYGPMESKSLERYSILKRLGAFGIDLQSARGGVAFMVQAKRVLARPSSVLWLTAEGAFTDARHRPVSIQQGLAHLARLATGTVVVPLAIEYTFWNESRPVALCSFGEQVNIDQLGNFSASQCNERFERALTRAMDQLSVLSMQRDPRHFRPLLRGTSGVGGIYDGFRRLRAWSKGQTFDSAHEHKE
jgi:1-acyl-sn-glycerol-3-phosphate acyltransferase